MALVFLKTMSLRLRIAVQLGITFFGQKVRSPVGSNSEYHFGTAVEVHVAQFLNTHFKHPACNMATHGYKTHISGFHFLDLRDDQFFTSPIISQKFNTFLCITIKGVVN